MTHMLAYTEEARGALEAMDKELRKACLNTIFRLLTDPYMKPAAPMNHSEPGADWLIPLAPLVMARYTVHDKSLVVTMIDVFDATFVD